VDPPLEAALAQIKQDRTHGAAQLAYSALTALHEYAVARCKSADMEADGTCTLDAVRNAGYHLADARPSMVPLANAVANVLAAVHLELLSRADPFGMTNGEVCEAIAKVRRGPDCAALAAGQSGVGGRVRCHMALSPCLVFAALELSLKPALHIICRLRYSNASGLRGWQPRWARRRASCWLMASQ
jgi:hypothetical protein